MGHEVVHALGGLPLIQGLEPSHIERLAALATEASFEKGQVIFRERDAHQWFYIILSGEVALEITAAGRTFRVQTLKAGEELGWSSMLAGERKHFQARALQPVRAAAFDAEKLQSACREDQKFGYAVLSRLLRVVSSRLEATRLRLLDVYAPQTLR